MKNFLVKAFICVESALFLAFTAMDVLGTGDSRWLKFAGIALCFVVSALLSARGGEVLVTAAVGLSAAADILLLVMDAHYAVGIALFLPRKYYILCASIGQTDAKARGRCGCLCSWEPLRYWPNSACSRRLTCLPERTFLFLPAM